MTKTPTQRVHDFFAGKVICIDPEKVGDAFREVIEFSLGLAAELEDAQALASQINTDWIPANKKLAAELEAAQRALAEERERIAGQIDNAAKQVHGGGNGKRILTQLAAAIRNAGEQATLTTEPSREDSGPASPAPDTWQPVGDNTGMRFFEESDIIGRDDMRNPPAPDEALIEEIVSRFLKCPLPSGVRVDQCATMPECPNRTGTNLLTASEAKEMFTQILSGIKRV